ncbi:MAG: LicD family protein [Oscillospiraceae bacterium]|nr:LicD family protein [Oscillospiraceae bacterium]
MKELTLQELKEIELDILKVFHAFCVEHNIRYFLSHGTLLGAIRYKKFIPWDDDVDVLVPREDYERLLSLYQDSDRYRLFSFEKDQNYRYPYAKLCDMTTRKVEFDYDNGMELGVDMDIFPLDAWDDDFAKAKQEEKRLSRNRFRLGLVKLKKPDSLNPVKRFVKGIVMVYCKMFGSAYYIRKIQEDANKPEQKGSAYMGNKAWCVYGQRDIMPAKVFAETENIEFEGEKFPAPKDYDTYLTCLYGDYLPEPPKEKQKTHHSFKAYRL